MESKAAARDPSSHYREVLPASTGGLSLATALNATASEAEFGREDSSGLGRLYPNPRQRTKNCPAYDGDERLHS
jgi:hypothetical protein